MALANSHARDATPLARRVCVGGLASALVVLQFTGLAHFFLVAHEICLEHGELVHSQPGTEQRSRASVVPGHVAFAQGDTARARELSHEHDHCDALLQRRARAVLSAPSGALEHPYAVVQPSTHVDADVPRALAILFVAPKSSPPAC